MSTYSHPPRCTCAICPPRPHREPDIEPGTVEHDLWRRDQARKQRIYETKFAETAYLRVPLGGTRTD
jgi:hypothetical protein